MCNTPKNAVRAFKTGDSLCMFVPYSIGSDAMGLTPQTQGYHIETYWNTMSLSFIKRICPRALTKWIDPNTQIMMILQYKMGWHWKNWKMHNNAECNRHKISNYRMIRYNRPRSPRVTPFHSNQAPGHPLECDLDANLALRFTQHLRFVEIRGEEEIKSYLTIFNYI